MFFGKQTNNIITNTYSWSEVSTTRVEISFQVEEISTTGKLFLKVFSGEQIYAQATLATQEGDTPPKLGTPNITSSVNFTSPSMGILSTGINLPSDVLAEQYSQLELAGKEHHVLKAIQVIDPSIVELRVMVIGKPSLYAKRVHESLLPLEFFGDAVIKLTRLTLGFLKHPNGIILIDEIENGIHYTYQKQVWTFIFQLAQQFNVQVFATTHSKEMADTFNQVALEKETQIEARYIEMSKHYKTNKIIGTILEPNILKHKIEHQQAFRGE